MGCAADLRRLGSSVGLSRASNWHRKLVTLRLPLVAFTSRPHTPPASSPSGWALCLSPVHAPAPFNPDGFSPPSSDHLPAPVCCSAEAGGGGSGTAVRSATLATMYEPPKEMLFCGTFDEAKQAAQRDGRWLVREGA